MQQKKNMITTVKIIYKKHRNDSKLNTQETGKHFFAFGGTTTPVVWQAWEARGNRLPTPSKLEAKRSWWQFSF